MNQPEQWPDRSEAPEKRTMASQLEVRVRQDIINGRLMPGSRLRLKELADFYDAGVIPLREALSRLAATGFVDAEDQKGFSVGRISAQEIRDITDTRLHIECRALALSISQGDVEWESRVIAAHHRLDRLPVIEGVERLLKPEWEVAHDAFHKALLSSCGSSWLLRFAATLRDQTARYRLLSMHYADSDSRDVRGEHKSLLDAALSKDIKAACEILSAHYEETTQRVLSHELLQGSAGSAVKTRKIS
ncbi:GntR family transcriptional regulator [Pseudomonas putida]|jgi:DNA-binding GntR family transcriptional regulator|uniref:GntR family transcriptional regulator n=1 Tax=Pseudomonas putida TaxID=303 RepID=UPI0009809E6E|nr:FCD domain-containing protein [Pseudomonas putida]OMQ40973.1 GntR family transcriptional regulator [Pseudomonas putida]